VFTARYELGRPWYVSELVSFLVGLRTYQHPGIEIKIDIFWIDYLFSKQFTLWRPLAVGTRIWKLLQSINVWSYIFHNLHIDNSSSFVFISNKNILVSKKLLLHALSTTYLWIHWGYFYVRESNCVKCRIGYYARSLLSKLCALRRA